MNDMRAVRRRYKQRYEAAAVEVVNEFDELKKMSWSLDLASLDDVEEAKKWIGTVDPNGVTRYPRTAAGIG
uniref:hypothetical protein n=1 Tax=Escherichia coli TaxID=562 RepID=UPI00311ADD44